MATRRRQRPPSERCIMSPADYRALPSPPLPCLALPFPARRTWLVTATRPHHLLLSQALSGKHPAVGLEAIILLHSYPRRTFTAFIRL
ncbi:hypothetical protein E2C01_034121 [Portunus trituberculatus]|uniref:Uncharacterized protein n=1 Tax=Portunus trituberculatus TaxID=210409 RepID=A0A5B7EZQ2_PORTR|nr:hypothetical protein [Portunus trituberculatus]